MKLTKRQESALLKVYHAYWTGYLTGDVKNMAAILDASYTQVGSADREVFYNKKDAVRFLRETIDQVAGKAKIKNQSIKVEVLTDNVLVNDVFDIYVLTDGKWVYYDKLRASTLMKEIKSSWKFIHQHSSVADMRTQDGENLATEKIAEENIKLKDAIKRRTIELEQKNKELEIETALERVRVVAMSMQKPEDLGAICKVLFHELLNLGFDEMRNTQVNIHDNERKSLLNYDYIPEKGSTTTIFGYDSHPLIKNLVKQLQKGNDFSSFSIGPGRLKEWRALRKKRGEKEDSKLKKAKSLFYCFYSIGNGAIGLSAISKLPVEKLDLLKRFRNVFDLAYRRYEDIKKAEGQAREAEIELSLERVRARTMAMQHSDELQESAILLFHQLKNLGVETGSCGFNIWDKEEKAATVWMSSPEGGLQVPFRLPHTISEIYKKVYKAMENGEDFFTTELAGKPLKKHFDYLATLPGIGDVIKKLQKIKYAFPSKMVYHFAFFNKGYLSFHTHNCVPKAHDIFRRFGKVFQQTYTRFLDLQKAEAQAREAEIELALERVRARSLAMQSSDELLAASDAMLAELEKLNINALRIGICTIDAKIGSAEVWSRSENRKAKVSKILGVVPKGTHPVFDNMVKAWKGNNPMYSNTRKGKEVKEYYRKLTKHLSYPLPKKYNRQETITAYFFAAGSLNVVSLEPLSKIEDAILLRFAKVFGQVYKRFLDLQKAEAQAREAQIEAALERVRARSMAMHQSEELGETSFVLFQEFKKLGATSEQISIGIIQEKENSMDLYSTLHGEQWQEAAKIDLDEPVVLRKIHADWKRNKSSLVLDLTGKDLKAYNKYRRSLSDLTYKEKRWVIHCAFFSKGVLTISSTTPFPPDTIHLLTRFASVFDGTYTRFQDLKKAEAQAKEAEIQLALERVRARTMAMHNSSELGEVTAVLFNQITSLTYAPDRFQIAIVNEEDKSFDIWVTTQGGDELSSAFVFRTEASPIVDQVFKAWKKKEKSLVQHLRGKTLVSWIKYVQQVAGIPFDKNQIPEDRYINSVFFSHGCIGITTNEAPPESSLQLIGRFAKVFQQTYTRFLDLQKAEAQAKEAQIEAALERVRARTMAMHSSKELSEVAEVLYIELIKLGLNQKFLTCGYVEVDLKKKVQTGWMTNARGKSMERFNLPLTGDPILQARYKAWKRNVLVFSQKVGGTALKKHIAFASPHLKSAEVDKHVKRNFPNPTIFTCGNFSNGYLHIITGEHLSKEEKSLFARFTNVFEQTYTRFLDLQKAEAQAREAEIELALERVRARTMAMHNSSELGEVAAVLFEQISLLTESPDRFNIGIINEEARTVDIWLTDQQGHTVSKLFVAEAAKSPVVLQLLTAWKSEKYLVQDLHGRKLDNWLNYMGGELGIPFDKSQVKEHRFINSVFFSHGFIGITTNEDPVQESLELITRFAKVFQQTYTRFLDLQKAEGQAREAQIEAALERVRSKAMAMHSTSDLTEASGVVFDELKILGIISLRSGIGLLEESTRSGTMLAARSSAKGNTLSLVGKIELRDNPILDLIYSKWLTKEIYSSVLNGNELKSYYDILLASYNDLPKPNFSKEEVQYGYFIPFTQGSFYAWTKEPYKEQELKTIKRFVSVIDLTYKRYFELQQVEARALDATRQASLDRVRGEIASMRSTEDLQRITPIVWKELTAMEIPFTRCGVFIVEEEAKITRAYLSASDGHSLGVLSVPFKSNELTDEVLKHWRQKKIFKVHWDKEQFEQNMQSMLEQGQIEGASSYQGSSAPESLHLHFIPFKQGMLYVGNDELLRDAPIASVKTLADSFSIAYSRYEDFKQLENALNELKATQSQLIQSEKMASLGELTAGIAHEIQNPLNFVNNFSEVSNELLVEMKEELEKGNSEEVKAIVKDVIENLEKILHHGKRADGIVKGMLQHSRASSGQKELTDINVLADEYLRLAFHGLRAKDKSFSAKFETDFDPSLKKLNVAPQDIGRVILNLITNAFYVVNERRKSQADGYEPTVWISTKMNGDSVLISVKDNGTGMPDSVKEKIFQPFFTTKPTGQGTGLGLSLSYDIVKAHGGELKVETKYLEGLPADLSVRNEVKAEASAQAGSEFIIQIPVVR